MTSHGLTNHLHLPQLSANTDHHESNSRQVVAEQMLALTQGRERQLTHHQHTENESSGSTRLSGIRFLPDVNAV